MKSFFTRPGYGLEIKHVLVTAVLLVCGTVSAFA